MSLTIKTDDVISGRKDVDLHGQLQRFSGEWVNVKKGSGAHVVAKC